MSPAWRAADLVEAQALPREMRTAAQETTTRLYAEIVHRAAMVQREGRTEVTIRLHPPELGRLRLHVAEVEGKVEVRIRVEDPGLCEALRQDARTLERVLRESDIDLARMEISDFSSGRRDGGRDADDAAPARTPPAEGTPVGRPAPGGDAVRTWTVITDAGRVDCLV